MSEAPAAEASMPPDPPPAPVSKAPPPIDPRLSDAQTLQKNPGPLPPTTGAKVIPPLHANRFAIEEFRNTRKWVCLPEGVPFEKVAEPAYWSMIAASLTVCDVIGVHNDERTFYGEVYVRDKGRNWADVAILFVKEFGKLAPEAAVSPEFEVKFKGPVNRWSVIRKSDNEALKDKCETKEAAQSWLSNYLKGQR